MRFEHNLLNRRSLKRCKTEFKEQYPDRRNLLGLHWQDFPGPVNLAAVPLASEDFPVKLYKDMLKKQKYTAWMLT